MEFEVYEGKELECLTCDRKIVCKYFQDVAMAWNARSAVMRGKCIYWVQKSEVK